MLQYLKLLPRKYTACISNLLQNMYADLDIVIQPCYKLKFRGQPAD